MLGIKLATKCNLDRVFALLCLINSTKTYTLCQKHLKMLFRTAILETKWVYHGKDRVCNGEDSLKIIAWASNEKLTRALLMAETQKHRQTFIPLGIWPCSVDTSKSQFLVRWGHVGQELATDCCENVVRMSAESHLKTADMDVETPERKTENQPLWRKKSLMLVTVERAKMRITWWMK